jgi:hypothetical protein
MTEKNSHRPFGKINFFYPAETAGGGTFQGTGDTATRVPVSRLLI